MADTPRHAASLKSMRPKVVDLLEQMEYLASARPRSIRHAEDDDFGWIWTELGLTPEDPGSI